MSKQINNGGPAFPFGRQVNESRGQPINSYHNDGMTLRDWFAGQALNDTYLADFDGPPESVADHCYAIADAMLARREVPNE